MPKDLSISPNAISKPKVIGMDIKKYKQAIAKIDRLERDLKYARECNEVKDKYWDKIKVERNVLKKRVEELETELYFCNRNKRVGEVVDERTKVETR